MKDVSPFGKIMFSVIFLLFMGTSNAKPMDYENIANLLPTEPQTINDTLAAIVRDSVVQDAVQKAVGNGSLEGLVVKKKVLVLPATESKVVSQREQVLVVPMTHLEDVQKNITETVNAETDVNDSTFTDIQSFTQNNDDGYASSENPPAYTSLRSNYQVLTETTRQPTFLIDNMPQKIPYLIPNPSQETALPENPPSVISVPIIAFLDPAKVSTDKIDVPIAAALTKRDDILKDQLKNGRDEIQRNVQSYIDKNTPTADPKDWLLTLSPSEMEVSSSLYEPRTIENRYMSDISSENLLPVAMPRIDIVTPLFWTSDMNINYPKNSNDMDTAADMVFRPLFRYRQEAQQKSHRRSAYRKYNSYYDSYPRRRYRYRPRYSDDYY